MKGRGLGDRHNPKLTMFAKKLHGERSTSHTTSDANYMEKKKENEMTQLRSLSLVLPHRQNGTHNQKNSRGDSEEVSGPHNKDPCYANDLERSKSRAIVFPCLCHQKLRFLTPRKRRAVEHWRKPLVTLKNRKAMANPRVNKLPEGNSAEVSQMRKKKNQHTHSKEPQHSIAR